MRTATVTLDELNAADVDGFLAALAGVVEHAPEIVRAAARHRPFGRVDDIARAVASEIAALPPDGRIALLQRHPELAGREAEAGTMTAESTAEQSGAGLGSLPPGEAERLRRLNAAFRARFGFPLIVAVRHHGRAAIFSEAERRLAGSKEEEIDEALAQVGLVVASRIADRVRS